MAVVGRIAFAESVGTAGRIVVVVVVVEVCVACEMLKVSSSFVLAFVGRSFVVYYLIVELWVWAWVRSLALSC